MDGRLTRLTPMTPHASVVREEHLVDEVASFWKAHPPASRYFLDGELSFLPPCDPGLAKAVASV